MSQKVGKSVPVACDLPMRHVTAMCNFRHPTQHNLHVVLGASNGNVCVATVVARKNDNEKVADKSSSMYVAPMPSSFSIMCQAVGCPGAQGKISGLGTIPSSNIILAQGKRELHSLYFEGNRLVHGQKLIPKDCLDFSVIKAGDMIMLAVVTTGDVKIFAITVERDTGKEEINPIIEARLTGGENPDRCMWCGPLLCTWGANMPIFSFFTIDKASSVFAIPAGKSSDPHVPMACTLGDSMERNAEGTLSTSQYEVALLRPANDEPYFTYKVVVVSCAHSAITNIGEFPIFGSKPLDLASVGPYLLVLSATGIMVYMYKIGRLATCIDAPHSKLFSLASKVSNFDVGTGADFFNRGGSFVFHDDTTLSMVQLEAPVDTIATLSLGLDDSVREQYEDAVECLMVFGHSVGAHRLMAPSATNNIVITPDYVRLLNMFRVLSFDDVEFLPKKGAKSCNGCAQAFTFSIRPHNCRNCGNIFCNFCCSQRDLKLVGYAIPPQRICSDCYAKCDFNLHTLLANFMYREAVEYSLEFADRCEMSDTVGITVLGQVFAEQDYEQAARLLSIVAQSDATLWEEWIMRFTSRKALGVLVRHIPLLDNKGAPLLEEWIFNTILVHLMKIDTKLMLSLLKTWPGRVFDAEALCSAVEGQLKILLQEATAIQEQCTCASDSKWTATKKKLLTTPSGVLGFMQRASVKGKAPEVAESADSPRAGDIKRSAFESDNSSAYLEAVRQRSNDREWQRRAIGEIYLDRHVEELVQCAMQLRTVMKEPQLVLKTYLDHYVDFIPGKDTLALGRVRVGAMRMEACGSLEPVTFPRRAPRELMNVFDFIEENALHDMLLLPKDRRANFTYTGPSILPKMVIMYCTALAEFLVRTIEDDVAQLSIKSLVEQLDDYPRTQIELLHHLTTFSIESTAPFHEKQAQLYIDYMPDQLITFLRNPKLRSVNWAELREAVKRRKMYGELAYVTGRLGDDKEAIRIIVRCLKDVRLAMQYVEDSEDPSLWEDLIRHVVQSPVLIGDMLDHIPGRYDVSKFMKLIPDNNKLRVPMESTRLHRIFYEQQLDERVLQRSLVTEKGDSLNLMQQLHGTKTKALRVEQASLVCGLCQTPLQTPGEATTGIVVGGCGHSFHETCVFQHFNTKVRRRRIKRQKRAENLDWNFLYESYRILSAEELVMDPAELLPPPVMRHIFRFIDARSLTIVQLVSTKWREVVIEARFEPLESRIRDTDYVDVDAEEFEDSDKFIRPPTQMQLYLRMHHAQKKHRCLDDPLPRAHGSSVILYSDVASVFTKEVKCAACKS